MNSCDSDDDDIRLSDVPKTVLVTIGEMYPGFTTQYATWEVDDIDMYERPDLTFYLIEVEADGQRDCELYFSADGTLLKNETDITVGK